MTEETSALTSAPPVPEAEAPGPEQARTVPAPEPARKQGVPGLVVVLLVGLVLAFAAIAWLWQQARSANDSLRQELATRLSDSDNVAREARAAARQGQDAIADLQRRLSVTEGSLAETRGQQAAIEALYQSLARNREDQLLVEVEQAVGLAMQQLQLAGNVEAALAAMRAAESRLAKADAAPLVQLRKALLADIELLASSPRLDVPGTAARIEVLVSAIDRMPLAFMAPPPRVEAEAPAMPGGLPEKLKRLGRELWAELRTLVRVERLDRPDPAFLSPAQEVFLRENLRLRLLSARLSVLARDDRTYHTDLHLAAEWLRLYFDADAEVVKNALSQIEALAAISLNADDVPMLQETYTRLRALQERGATRSEPAATALPPAAARPPGPAATPARPAAARGDGVFAPGPAAESSAPESHAPAASPPAAH